MPILSICIPTRNRAEYLRRHLAHLETFTLDCEIVVSDNCSDDNTYEVVSEFRARMPNLFYVRQPRPLNFYETMIAACNLAAGTYAMYAADDDALVEEGIAHVLSIMERDAGISAVYGAWQEWDPANQVVITSHAAFDCETQIGHAELLELYTAQQTPEMPIFRVSGFRASHLPVQHQYAFDFFGAALFAETGRLVFSPVPTVRVTRHAGQESHRFYRPDILQCYLADYELFLSRYPDLDVATSTVLATRSMAEQYLSAARRAIANREFLQARTLLQRIAVYRPEDSRAGLLALEQAHFGDMVVEVVRGLIDTMQPVRRILCAPDESCRQIAKAVAAATDCGFAEIGNGPDDEPVVGEDDFVLYHDDALMARLQAGLAFPLRRARRLDTIVAALRRSDAPALIEPVPLAVAG
ncbi:MAG: glycosyltransferase family 2 protein [Alphaproteobacteria bacterium]|nr:glycosyltransferase family 2 protein [Alphaproteobacteria bacterium]